ncbi:MAG: hypothetical protein PVH88_19470 [Ignavibacteria bacterium]|jgi:hypothetical protein
MKEFNALDIKFPKKVEVFVRVQCKECNGTGFILTEEAEALREKYKEIVSSDYSIDEKKTIDKEILDFELAHKYNPLAQFAKCKACENSGQIVKYVDIRKLINADI